MAHQGSSTPSSESRVCLLDRESVLTAAIVQTDVVPVNPATLNQWTHKPYDAHEDDDGWIWGRGVADCKNTVRA